MMNDRKTLGTLAGFLSRIQPTHTTEDGHKIMTDITMGEQVWKTVQACIRLSARCMPEMDGGKAIDGDMTLADVTAHHEGLVARIENFDERLPGFRDVSGFLHSIAPKGIDPAYAADAAVSIVNYLDRGVKSETPVVSSRTFAAMDIIAYVRGMKDEIDVSVAASGVGLSADEIADRLEQAFVHNPSFGQRWGADGSNGEGGDGHATSDIPQRTPPRKKAD